MRALTHKEKQFIIQITSKGLDMTLLEITETGLHKSIMDATEPVRQYFLDNSYHNYSIQEQGQQYKVLKTCKILSSNSVLETQISMYRPETKMGDPRLWIYNLKEHAKPNDIIGLIIRDNTTRILNISELSDLVQNYFETDSPSLRELKKAFAERNKIADELRMMIQDIARRGPIRAVCSGDTAIGRTLETHLGIKINSSKAPDYKGIELKSSRHHATVKTLFAQVPNWDISPLKSSKEILSRYGYERDSLLRLYCTVSTQNKNSQGLSLKINEEPEKALIEFHKNDGDIAIWLFKVLRERLLEKHKETFWLTAMTENFRGIEHFTFTKIEHTKNPIPLQFELLLADGGITLDHLIKRNTKGRITDKGPLFKIKTERFNELFPPSQIYELTG